MSDSHREAIWQRGSAREIMREARRRFRESEAAGDYAGASTKLASDHYSLVKRYLSPVWKRPLAVWHLFMALHHAKRVANGLLPRTFDQVDVVARILAKAPQWLGGDKETARALIVNVLDYIPVAEPQDEMKPHTRALMLITLAEIEQVMGKSAEEVDKYYRNALRLVPQISESGQACRVMSAIGFFFFDNNHEFSSQELLGFKLVREALLLAKKEKINDQYEKIRNEARKRGLLVQLGE